MSTSLLLRVLVFISGASVMAVEMTALRLLAPFFGTSLLVTTILIGSMMGFLSLGYYLGGKYADKHPRLDALCKVTGGASILVIFIPFISQPILRAAAAVMRPLLQGETLQEPTVALATLIGGILGVLALFAVPVTLMGMTSPWAVRLAVDSVDDAGKAAGRLYALSTFGSIIGSFAPALVLVPLLGTRNTFIVAGVTLLTISALGIVGSKGAAAAAAVLIAFLPQSTLRPMDGLVHESESNYHFIQVVVEPYGKCPEANHLYLNEGIGIHSVKCLDDRYETRGTWAYMAAAPLWRDTPQSVDEVLIIGLAGGSVARQLLESWPMAHIDGVEIDGAVVDIGKEYFDNDDERISPFVMDGRIFLQATDRKYDVILVDAYRQPYIPFHLTTTEFWAEVDAHLTEDGVVAINVASVKGVDDGLLKMIYATMREHFPMITKVEVTSSNDILYATRSVKDTYTMVNNLSLMPAAKGLDQLRPVLRRKTSASVEGWRDVEVLTDDKAPVEMAWDLQALEFI